MRRQRMDAWKGWLMVCVIGAHLWVGWALTHFQPEMKRTATHPRTESVSTELLLVLTFQTRADKEPKPGAKRARSPRRSRSSERSGIAASPDTAVASAATDPGPRAPLDLAAPAAPEPGYARGDPMRRHTALEYRETRYDKAWISDGNLTQVVARRSIIAGVLLGAMGALIKPCTEKQMSQYDRACVTDQYRHPDPGELLGEAEAGR